MRSLLPSLLACLLALAVEVRAQPARWVVVFESPAAAVVHAVAAAPAVDVRWVEQGLIVAEVEDEAALQPAWGARRVARRSAAQALALLRAADRIPLQREPRAAEALAGLQAAHVATARAEAGEVWLLLGRPEDWPRQLLGCHGGLVLPQHGVDPRSLLEAGPMAALRAWAGTPPRRLTLPERTVLAAVSQDSIVRSMQELTRDLGGQPANRHVFATDLDGLYSPRVESRMQRAVQGIPGATVRRQGFAKSRSCGGVTVVDSTYNVIARIPGQVPGTGIFVVCAHIDATGARNLAWAQARNACDDALATPGSEDNATGVAAMLEVLRCAAAGVRRGELDLAFDLEFIAFSGEEAEGREGGLTGSRHYVDARVGEGAKLLGAFNLDMVGSDSLGNNLQVVHNVASRWLAEWLDAAAGMAQPAIALDLRLDLDESLASDHNSFWSVNVPALLGADAPIDVLRQYASYHRPTDLGADVSAAKTAEVARAFLAALLQFNRLRPSEPALVFPTGLQLSIAPQGVDLPYDAATGFFRVWPGSPVKGRLSFYNVGAAYAAPLRVEVWFRSPRALEPAPTMRLLFDCRDDSCFARGGAERPLQTGDRLDFRVDPIPVLPQDRGECEVVAQVTFRQGGNDSVQVFTAPLLVSEQQGLPLRLSPNPVRIPERAQLALALERPGSVHVQLYNAAGRRVATQVTAVEPHFQARESHVFVPLRLQASGQVVPSGVYFLRVEWNGPGGERQTSVARLVVVR